MVRMSLLLVMLVVSLAGVEAVELYKCGMSEWHCLDTDAQGVGYVKGIFTGQATGYFEGAVEAGDAGGSVASLNYFGANQTTFSSAARVEYHRTGASVASITRSRWASGLGGDARHWSASEMSTNTMCELVSATPTDAELRTMCLWSSGGVQNFASILPRQSLDGTRWTVPAQDQSLLKEVSVCHRDVTTFVAVSHPKWMGLQRDTVRFSGRDSHGFAGVYRTAGDEYGSFVGVVRSMGQGQAEMVAKACDSSGLGCQDFVLPLASVSSPCSPKSSLPPKHQYGQCPAAMEVPDSAHAPTETRMYTCTSPTPFLANVTYSSSPGDVSTEYHCVDFVDGQPAYVKGTYGMMGYFEGGFAQTPGGGVSNATVSWYEASGPHPETRFGAAVFTYSSSFDAVKGMSWSANLSSGMSAYGSREPSTCTLQPTNYDMMRSRCLWQPRGRLSVNAATNGLHGARFASDMGDRVDVETCHHDRSTLIAMNTKYSPNTCNMTTSSIPTINCSESNIENATASPPGTVRLSLMDSFGFVSTWEETDPHSPRAGMRGTAIYVVTQDVNTSQLALEGFECSGRPGFTFETITVTPQTPAPTPAPSPAPTPQPTPAPTPDPSANGTNQTVEATPVPPETTTALPMMTTTPAPLPDIVTVTQNSVDATWDCQRKRLALSDIPVDCEAAVKDTCKLDMNWQEVRARKQAGQAFTGGLGEAQSIKYATDWNHREEYGVWTCIKDWDRYAQLECEAEAGMLVCFRYDEVGKEFRYWGKNDHVKVVVDTPPDMLVDPAPLGAAAVTGP